MNWFRSAAFNVWKKPKKHSLVEDAERLTVLDVLGLLSETERRTLREWHPWTHPDVLLVRSRRGALDPYWHFRCTCGRRVEALYRPAGERDWKCRTCHSLIYASHRHPNPQHPSRVRLPYRTKRRRQREAKRQQRNAERHPRTLQKKPATVARIPETVPEEPSTQLPLTPEEADLVTQIAELEVRVEAAKIAAAGRRAEIPRRQLDDGRRAQCTSRIWSMADARRAAPPPDPLDGEWERQLRWHQLMRRLARC